MQSQVWSDMEIEWICKVRERRAPICCFFSVWDCGHQFGTNLRRPLPLCCCVILQYQPNGFSNGCRYCISVKGFITNWVLGAQIVFAQTVANLEAVHIAVCFSREHQVTSIWERFAWYVCCKCSNSIASWKHIDFKCSCSKCLIGSLLSRPDNEIRD